MWHPICRYTRPEDSYAVGTTVLEAFENKGFKKWKQEQFGSKFFNSPTLTCTLFVEIELFFKFVSYICLFYLHNFLFCFYCFFIMFIFYPINIYFLFIIVAIFSIF